MGGGAILGGLSWEVIFEQRPERGEGTSPKRGSKSGGVTKESERSLLYSAEGPFLTLILCYLQSHEYKHDI